MPSRHPAFAFVMALAKTYNRIAHHGAGTLYNPGNTIAALHVGADAGADMIELDLRETLDHVLVLSQHTARKVGGREIPIGRHTYDEWMETTSQANEAPIDTLEDALTAAAARKVGLLIDVKEPGLENALARLVRRLGVQPATIMVAVPSDGSKIVLRSLDPTIPIAHKIEPHETSLFTPKLIDSLSTDAVYWAPKLITKERVAKLRAKDIITYTGPINTATEMRRLRDECKVHGIVTEFPDVLATI